MIWYDSEEKIVNEDFLMEYQEINVQEWADYQIQNLEVLQD